MGPEFDTPPPTLSDDELHRIAAEVFHLRGALLHLPGERDQNVRVATQDGSFVLKVANAGQDPEGLEMQDAVLRHLRQVDPGLMVPHVLPPGTTPFEGHLVRAVTYLPGVPYASVAHSPTLRHSLGAFMGRLSTALQGFEHQAAHRPAFLWNLDAAQAVRPWTADIDDPDDRAVVERAFHRHEQRVVPVLGSLRTAVVHHDANDHNVLVSGGHVSGLVDFGDVVHACQVNELAVTLAYALLDVTDVVAAATDVIAGYTEHFPLTDDELRVLFDLVATRLAMSVAISSHRGKQFPSNDYLQVSRRPALGLLRRLTSMRPEFLHFAARAAAGLSPVPRHDAIVGWLRSPACTPADVLPFPLGDAPNIVVSLAEDAPLASLTDPHDGWAWLQQQMADAGAVVALGRYGEDRSCYAGEQFTTDAPEPRSVHIGIDLFVADDTPIHAMLPGVVETVVDNDLPFDYGPTVILRHEAGDAGPFWVLYGHLSRRTLTTVQPGQSVQAGEVVGFVGDPSVNGNWPPHVHVQIMTDLMADPDTGPDGNFEGAGEPSRMHLWRSIVPDANLLLRIPALSTSLSPET